MNITVKLFATLRKNRFEQKQIQIQNKETIRDIVENLAIPLKDIAIIFLNGRHASLEQHLTDNDVLALFPPVGGG